MKICSVCQRYYEDSVEFCAENHGSLMAARTEASRETVGKYRLDALLEHDAASETYRATHTSLDQPFIVQIIALNPANEAENQLEKLQTEARAAASINHPNVARVYESGTLDSGDFYVVTESLSGQTLRDYLNDVGTLSETEAVVVARQTAYALTAAHAVGVIHRAVNPSNIILNTDEENRLSIKLQNFDFGAIRQQIAVSAGISAVNSSAEAQRYLSPEQSARGEAVDARTDVFSLGVVLYEMLCGRSPFEEPTLPATVEKQIDEQPLAQLRYDVRALFTYLLKQTMQTSQAARLPSAANFARQLRQIELLVAPPAIVAARALPQTSAPKKIVSDLTAFSNITPAPPVNELPLEIYQPRDVVEYENADVVAPPVNAFAAQLPTQEIKENTIDENDFPGDTQPIFVRRREAGGEPFVEQPIYLERKQPISVEMNESSVASSESQPIHGAGKHLEAFPRESIPFVVENPSQSEPFFVKNEENFIEPTVPAETAASPVNGVRMREKQQSAMIPNRAYEPPRRASRRLAPPNVASA